MMKINGYEIKNVSTFWNWQRQFYVWEIFEMYYDVSTHMIADASQIEQELTAGDENWVYIGDLQRQTCYGSYKYVLYNRFKEHQQNIDAVINKN